jgi:hypothetical protein
MARDHAAEAVSKFLRQRVYVGYESLERPAAQYTVVSYLIGAQPSPSKNADPACKVVELSESQLSRWHVPFCIGATRHRAGAAFSRVYHTL